MNMKWTNLHQEVCISKKNLYASANDVLCHIQNERNFNNTTSTLTNSTNTNTHTTVLDDNDKINNDTDDQIMDEITDDLTLHTFFLSPHQNHSPNDTAVCQSHNHYSRTGDSYYLMCFRNEDATTTTKPKNNSFTLWESFSLLSLSSSSNEKLHKHGTNHDSLSSDNDLETKERILLKHAAQFLSKQFYLSNDFISQKSKHVHEKHNSSSSSNVNKENIEHGLFRSFSKRVYSKASSMFVSLLATYDLAEYQDNNEYEDIDDSNEDIDDAIVYKSSNISDDDPNTFNDKRSISCALTTDDVLWNINIILSCIKTIIEYSKAEITNIKSNNYHDHRNMSNNILTSVSVEIRNETHIIHGLMLNRYGDGNRSFLKFCRTISKAIMIGDIEVVSEQSNVLPLFEKISSGFSLDLFIMTLVSLNQATMSSDGDVVIIFPNSLSYDTLMTSRTNNSLHEINAPIKTKVDDSDVAEFKLMKSISSIESRIEYLTSHSDDLKSRAIKAKRDQQINVALLYMKRRKLINNEIEKYSSTLLNLETGLHSLQSARSQKQVIQAFSLLNTSIKEVMDGCDLNHVNNVINELEEINEEVELVNQALSTPFKFSTNILDDTELEKELASCQDDLMASSLNNSKIQESQDSKMEAKKDLSLASMKHNDVEASKTTVTMNHVSNINNRVLKE